MAETTPTDKPAADKTPPAAEAPAAPAELAITAVEFVRDRSHWVAVSGLLASDDELRTAQLPASEWEQLLDAYMRSPRP